MKESLRFAQNDVVPLLLALSLTACGQGPSFLERENSSSSQDATEQGSTDVSGKPGEVGPDGEVILPGGSDWTPDWADGTVDPEGNPEPLPGEDGDNPSTGMPVIPDADDDDLTALHRCLKQWKNHPFKGTVNNYQRIYASVTVGGYGNAINDDERTDEPFLTLIDAGVNVLGAPTYNLVNPNGYYCMKVNVNVQTALTINLHCSARLADSRVNVNVGSTMNDATSAVGVHVLSTVDVKTVRPEGDTCIR